MSYIERLSYLRERNIMCDTLELRRLQLSLCTFYNIYRKHVCCDVLDNFRPGALYLRGNSCRLYVPFCKTKVRKEFFTFKLLSFWNSLPESVVSSNVTNAFKWRLGEIDFNEFLRWKNC